MFLFVTGCGGTAAMPSLAGNESCTGARIAGKMVDSLTGLPVFMGNAAFETGTLDSSRKFYSFTESQESATAPDGSFALCAGAATGPSALVLVAVDASGGAYPAFVAGGQTTGQLGNIAMGGCDLTCAFMNQQQTSLPAQISGSVTTDPVAETAHLAPAFAIDAPDGTKTFWTLLVPRLLPSEMSLITTAKGSCPGNAADCAGYSYEVPSQMPQVQTNTGVTQGEGAPVYEMSASLSGSSVCSEQQAATFFESGGKTPLLAPPGVATECIDVGVSWMSMKFLGRRRLSSPGASGSRP